MKLYYSIPDTGLDVHRALSNTEPFKGFDTGSGIGTPVEGDRWILSGTLVAPFNTGSVNDIAEYINGAWDFRTPTDGMFAYSIPGNTYYSYDADNTTWESSAGSVLTKTETIVISNTTFDLSFVPLGDLGEVKIGNIVNGDLKVKSMEIIESGSISGTTVTLPSDYDGQSAVVTYVYNSNA
jgi:hypothetical protein